MTRSIRNRRAEIRLGETVEFSFDGKPVAARAGDSIAAALLDNGVPAIRNTPANRASRGLFCCMGLCQECLVYVDGVKTEACIARVGDGLQVRSIPLSESRLRPHSR